MYGTPVVDSVANYNATVTIPGAGFTVAFTGDQDNQTEAQRDAKFQEIVDFLAGYPGLVDIRSHKTYGMSEDVTPTS